MASAEQPGASSQAGGVRRHHVVLVFLGVVLLWAALAGSGALVLYRGWVSSMAVHDQPVRLFLPDQLTASAEIASRLHSRLQAAPRVVLPIDQAVKVDLGQELSARATVRTVVPVETDVRFRQAIPVSTEVSAEVPVVSWLPAMSVKLPVRVEVPVDVTVPVRLSLPLALDLQARGRLAGPLSVPVRTKLDMRIPISAEVEGEVTSRADFRLLAPVPAMDLRLLETRIGLPLSDLELYLPQPPQSCCDAPAAGGQP